MILYPQEPSYISQKDLSLTIDLQRGLWNTALQHEASVAWWRLPGDNMQHMAIDLGAQITQTKLDLEESVPGFAISPFVNPALKHTYFIKADLHLKVNTHQKSSETILNKTESDTNTRRDNFLSDLEKRLQTKQRVSPNPFFRDDTENFSEEARDYINLVERGVAAIRQKVFKKVALSRTKTVDYPFEVDIVELFQRLCSIYPHAFCSLFHIPGVGTWMGASPETLISVDQQHTFRTIALAGTQAFQPGLPLSEVAWRQKEIEEQAMVSRYIINCFKRIRLREFEEEGPKTAVAGNLLHLRTDFAVDMQATNFPQLGTVMLDLLHPTSAVCGMPKAPAEEFILRNEGYAREFYSGFLGPVNIEQESHIFVNLRCMQLLRKNIRLYAGAGITEYSNPSKEWQETEMKCQTMLRVLRDAKS